jgi:ribonuclease HI
MDMKRVTLYTDGACSGNPGPGGYGAILIYKGHEKEISGGEEMTTNNRMELMAAIAGLEALNEPCAVDLYSDSKYLVDGVSKGWAASWQSRGWIKPDKKPAQNPDLWDRLLKLLDVHQVTLHWVKGHAENEYNKRCDRLAVAESMKFSDQTDSPDANEKKPDDSD